GENLTDSQTDARCVLRTGERAAQWSETILRAGKNLRPLNLYTMPSLSPSPTFKAVDQSESWLAANYGTNIFLRISFDAHSVLENWMDFPESQLAKI
ncbi:unnamed protein product, partial [Allacma fusca]